MPNRKYLVQTGSPYPHMGKLLEDAIHVRNMPKADLCRALDITHTGVAAYCKQPSLQGGILWKAGLVLKYNFFADLAAQFPYPPEAENPLQKQAEEQAKRIAELEKELAIYKSIVHNK